jgi:sterol desaturase/sphingolipid hydroxylase (fatty acid hydroxylase superfamily)
METDLRAARARGGWLVVAWALAVGGAWATYVGGRAWWPAVLAAFGDHDVLRVVAVLQAANVGQELLWNAVMAVLMSARLPAIERYKVNPKPWPFTAEASPADRTRFAAVARSTFWRALVVNNGLIGTPLIVASYLLLRGLRKEPALRADLASFPSPAALAWQLAAALVVEDAMFYWAHRTMHAYPALYTRIHKVHHEYTQNVVSASEHAHPVEFVVGNLLPVITPVILLRMHLFAAAVFTGVRIFVSAEEHCGYAFPWSPVRLLPFQASVEGHDFHHSHNVGVYASQFVWWDRLMGTDAHFLRWRAGRLDAADAAAAKVAAAPVAPADGKPARAGVTTRASGARRKPRAD